MRRPTATSVVLYLMAVLFVVIVLIAIADDRLIVRFFHATPLIRQVAVILVLLTGAWICYRAAQVMLNGIEMIRRRIRDQ